jgi:hypothetical protein
VTIRVQGRDFRLPKDILCYNSTYFDKKLNGNTDGIKAEDSALVLPNGSPEDFELIVQWMYMSNVVPPYPIRIQSNGPNGDAPGTKPKEGSAHQQPKTKSVDSTSDHSSTDMPQKMTGHPDNITAYVRFFKMAHELGLLGPFELIYRRIRASLVSSDLCLMANHIRSAAELPCGHPVRKLFAQYCVVPYVTDMKMPFSREFRFGVELNEVEAFAADLFREYHRVMWQGVMEMEQNSLFFQFNDPLTGKIQRVPCTYKRV